MPPPPLHSPRDYEEIDMPHFGYLIPLPGHFIPHGSHNGACADEPRGIRGKGKPLVGGGESKDESPTCAQRKCCCWLWDTRGHVPSAAWCRSGLCAQVHLGVGGMESVVGLGPRNGLGVPQVAGGNDQVHLRRL